VGLDVFDVGGVGCVCFLELPLGKKAVQCLKAMDKV
jgi:hypothetical protein